VQVRLPPLCERGDDIVLLARHFLQLHAARYGKPAPALTAEAEQLLRQHRWPGNVRELRNVIEQAVLLNSGAPIGAAQLALSTLGAPEPASAAPRAAAERTLPEMERQALLHALQLSEGNVTRAARELGISRDTLRYRMEKYGLEGPARPAARDTR
jgi:two-component system, NtrC family, response regulator AtoC